MGRYRISSCERCHTRKKVELDKLTKAKTKPRNIEKREF
jgi:PHP family Zn ribbon phosphoesterase